MKKSIQLIFLCPSLLLVLVSGCATTGQSVGLGAGSGALLGAGAGALADPGSHGGNRVRNVLIGTAIGGALGAGVGYLAGHNTENEKSEAYQKGKGDEKTEQQKRASNPDGTSPQLIAPKTEARWVPDQVRGTVFIPGHFEYVILEGAHWEVVR